METSFGFYKINFVLTKHIIIKHNLKTNYYILSNHCAFDMSKMFNYEKL